MFPNYALFNAQWAVGQTYSNSTYGLSIKVVSRSGSTFVVTVAADIKRRRGQTISQ